MKHRYNVANVLVIGTGAAGMRAAIAAHEAGLEVNIVGKRLRRDAHTVLAAGGINAALGTVDFEDRWEHHYADTVQEGYFLGNPDMVEIMVKQAPRAIYELIDYGVPFATQSNGELDQRYFGAHRYRRTCYAGDYTGRAIIFALADKVESLDIPIYEHQYVTRLLVENGHCFGAFAFNIQTGERTVYLADSVILAAGGHTRLWRRSSSRRDENTGDGMYLALQAGAEVADMELVQFHPTGMVAPESIAGTLVTEAVRGEGGRLYNANGERFMERYDPVRMELSTRDRVALANYTEISEGRGGPNGGVYLDISHLDKATIIEKLPRMYRQFLEHQLLDISEERMEVAPTAHYTMGGVVVDAETHATSVVGLYAAGEVTSGLHGANRLGGNSLVETIVFGRMAGEAAARFAAEISSQPRSNQAIHAAHADLDRFIKPGSQMARPLQRSVRDVMWQHGGVVRNEKSIRLGLAELVSIQAATADLDVRPSSEGFHDLALALDLRAAILSARLTLLGALERRETRGCHVRQDFPELDHQLDVNFVMTLTESGEIEMEDRPVQPIPDNLRPFLSDEELAVEGRLLE